MVAIIVGLWFAPSLLHLRTMFVPYQESFSIAGSGANINYVERAVILHSFWQTSVSVTVSASSQVQNPVRIMVMDQQSYTNFLAKRSYSVIYDSGTVMMAEFNIPLQLKNAEDTIYQVVFQNPYPATTEVTNKISISYEMALLGHTIIEWLSRISIALAIVAVLQIEARRRNITFSDIPGLFKQTAKLIVNSPPTEPITSMQESTSGESAETREIGASASLQDSQEELPQLLGEYLVDANKTLGIPLLVERLETIIFNIDVNPGSIDIHVYDEAKFVELNGRNYFRLSRVGRIFESAFSTAVHSVRGLEWTPTKLGKHIIVLDNSDNGIQKRCKLDYSSSTQ